MESGTVTPSQSGRSFDHLREHSIGLPQVLFQSTFVVRSRSPDKLREMERVSVEDETVARPAGEVA
jgi:hypothetical protein